MNVILRSFTAASSLLALAACSSTNSGNTSRAQFLDEVWVASDIQGKSPRDLFSKVYFAPVSVARLSQQGWWSSQNNKSRAQLQSDARMLARYMHDSLVKASSNYSGPHMQVVDKPGRDTLIVETAITELVPAKVFWNAAATTAGFIIPGAGLLGAAGKGAIGIEGRLRDGNTGAIKATFRDRDTDRFAVLNGAAYTWYHGSQANIDELAQKTAEVLNAPAGSVVKSSAPIKLMAF